MAIKSYANQAAYDAATKSTIESTVSLIETSRDIIVDGVNVVTNNPAPGDVLFLDESNNKVFLKGGNWIQKAIIPTAWTHVGYVYYRHGKKVGIIDKTAADDKYADVLQFAITAISSTNVTITVKNSSGDNAVVSVTLSAAAINATTAGEIDAAIRAANIDSNDWWAYLDGDRIIVQCDTWAHYSQYSCSMSGGTISFITWGDMPASDVYFKSNGKSTNYRGLMNFTRGVAYWSTNGNTPSETVQLGAAGNDNPVTSAAFVSSEYCNLLRAAYSTYEEYLRGEFGIQYPQKYGTFALPDAAELSATYALLTAPTRAGSTKYKFPALSRCALVDYPSDGLRAGDWHLPSSLEGCILMDDDTLAAIQPAISKMGTSGVNNSTYRWFAERYGVNSARYFSGASGTLSYNNVYNRHRVQGVALLNID